MLELFLLCLKIFCFYFLTVRHILVQICVCVRLFIWGHQILCILKRVKIFPKQSINCHKKKITVSWNHFSYDIIPQCGNVCSSERWWGDRRIKTGNVAVQCSHCGLVTVATKTIIQWATCRCCMSNSWTWFLDKIQKMEMNEQTYTNTRKQWNTETLANLKKLIQTCVEMFSWLNENQ